MRKVDPSFIVYTAEKTLLGTKKEIPADNARKVAIEREGDMTLIFTTLQHIIFKLECKK